MTELKNKSFNRTKAVKYISIQPMAIWIGKEKNSKHLPWKAEWNAEEQTSKSLKIMTFVVRHTLDYTEGYLYIFVLFRCAYAIYVKHNPEENWKIKDGNCFKSIKFKLRKDWSTRIRVTRCWASVHHITIIIFIHSRIYQHKIDREWKRWRNVLQIRPPDNQLSIMQINKIDYNSR